MTNAYIVGGIRFALTNECDKEVGRFRLRQGEKRTNHESGRNDLLMPGRWRHEASHQEADFFKDDIQVRNFSEEEMHLNV